MNLPLPLTTLYMYDWGEQETWTVMDLKEVKMMFQAVQLEMKISKMNIG